MTPAFLRVTLDEGGGIEVIDILEIQRFGGARGSAKGSRIRFRDGTVIDIEETPERIEEAMRDAGVMRD